jgi:hypothetical protein
MEENNNLTGGDFLVKEVSSANIFIPEEFNEEQKMITQTCDDFLESEVFPMLDRIDKQELGLMPKLLSKAGELGLLAISIPEEYEGFGQSFLTAMRANEALGAGYSFTVAYSAHVGIGTMPEMKCKSGSTCPSWQPANGLPHIALPSLMQGQMPTPAGRKPPYRMTESIISLTVRKCGSPMAVLPMCSPFLPR